MKTTIIAVLLLLTLPFLIFADRNLERDAMIKTTVLIFNPDGGGMSVAGWLGSGVIVSDDGYIVTNRHVVGWTLREVGTDKEGKTIYSPQPRVDGTQRLVVYHEDWGYGGARVVAVSNDPYRDLAVIKIETTEPLPFSSMGSVENMFPGDTVYSVGHPHGVGWVITKGVIGKFLKTEDHNRFILHDASINPGNSGGPLYDEWGKVIGLNFAAFPPFAAENMSLAIDGRVVARFVELAITFDRLRLEVLSEGKFESSGRVYSYDGALYRFGK